jgi:hypothetical protein
VCEPRTKSTESKIATVPLPKRYNIRSTMTWFDRLLDFTLLLGGDCVLSILSKRVYFTFPVWAYDGTEIDHCCSFEGSASEWEKGAANYVHHPLGRSGAARCIYPQHDSALALLRFATRFWSIHSFRFHVTA